MRIFVSSTFEDLREHRAAAIRVLRQLGHEVLAMEDMVAASNTPLARVIQMVDRSDAYVGIFAWRYGYVPRPAGASIRPAKRPSTVPDVKDAVYGVASITHYEILRARQKALPILAFLLDERAPWPPSMIDGHSTGPDAPPDASRIRALRDELQRERIVAWFTTPADLEARVAAAITMTGLSQQIDLADTLSLGMGPGSARLDDSGGNAIVRAVGTARSSQRLLKIDLADTWWSTRLYLTAWMAERLTQVRRLLVVESDAARHTERHVALVSTSAVLAAIRPMHPQIAHFERLAARVKTSDDASATAQLIVDAAWQPAFRTPVKKSDPYAGEAQAQKTASVDLLQRWLGGAMLDTAVAIPDLSRASVVDLLLLVSYPSELVPVSTTRASAAGELARQVVDVVDKSSLNHRLALTYLQELKERARIA